LCRLKKSMPLFSSGDKFKLGLPKFDDSKAEDKGLLPKLKMPVPDLPASSTPDTPKPAAPGRGSNLCFDINKNSSWEGSTSCNWFTCFI